METSFLEMRLKEVINVVDGRLLGHIVDMVFDIRTSRVLGFVVPASKGFFSVFKPSQEIFIPYNNICKIGEDVMLVELYNLPKQTRSKKHVGVLNKQQKQQQETNEKVIELDKDFSTKIKDDVFNNEG